MMLVAMGLGFLMAATAFGVDHGRITTNRRNLQKIADLIALDVVGELDGRTTSEVRDDVEDAIAESAIRNGFVDAGPIAFAGGVATLSDGRAIAYEIGKYSSSRKSFTVASGDDVPNSVRTVLTDDIHYFFQPGGNTSSKQATALYLLPGGDDPDPGCIIDCTPPDPDCVTDCDEPFSSETFSLGSFVGGFSASTPDTIENQRLNATKALVMNAVWGRAFSRTDDAPAQPNLPSSFAIPPSQLDISVVGYKGLAGTYVTLDELRAALNFASINELLQADVGTRDFIDGLIAALNLPSPPAIPATGDSRIDNRLDAIAGQVPNGVDTSTFNDPSVTAVRPEADGPTTAAAITALNKTASRTLPSKTIPIRDLITVRTGYEATAADAQFNVLELVGSAALINGGNFFSVDTLLPVQSPDAPSLPTLLSNRLAQISAANPAAPDLVATYSTLAALWPSSTELVLGRLGVSVVEPPVTVVGPPGFVDGAYLTLAETAQVRSSFTVKLLDVALADLLNLGGPLIPFSPTSSASLVDLEVPIVVTGGEASAGLSTIDCFDLANGIPSGYDVQTQAFTVRVASSPDLSAATPSFSPAPIVTAGGSTLNLQISGSASITLDGAAEPDFAVAGPYGIDNRYSIIAPPGGDVGASLLNNLSVSIPSLSVLGPIPQLTRTIAPADQNREIQRALTRRLPVLDMNVLRPLSEALGVGIGGAELTASDVECGVRVLVSDD